MASLGALYTFASFVQFLYNIYFDLCGDSDPGYYTAEAEALKKWAPDNQKLHDAWLASELANTAAPWRQKTVALLLAIVGTEDVVFPTSELHKVHAVDWQLGFQPATSTSMESIISFHDDMMFYLIFITLFVLFMLVRTVQIFWERTTYKNVAKEPIYYDRLTHHVGLEIT